MGFKIFEPWGEMPWFCVKITSKIQRGAVMRKIKVGALQPSSVANVGQYRWGNPSYKPDVDNIIKHCIMPQAEITFALLEKAGRAGLDVVTTCEDISLSNAYIVDTTESNVFPEIVNRCYSTIEERISAIAIKYNMNIIACYYKPDGNDIYNTASAFNRKGEIVGEYRKTHMPCDELFQVKAGGSIHTIDMDFGRIGIMICYDMMFPAMVETLSLLGAEVVFHPTFGYGWNDSIGEATVRTRASDGSFYLAVAKNYAHNAAGKSSIIDYWGTVLADAGFEENALVWAEIDLDKEKVQPDWHVQSIISGQVNMRVRHEGERRPDLYGIVCEEARHKYNIIAAGKEQDDYRTNLKEGIWHW